MFEHWYVIDPGAYSVKLLDIRGKKRTAIHSCIAYQGEEIVAVSKDAYQYIYEASHKVRIKPILNHSQMLNPMNPVIRKAFEMLEVEKNIFKPGVIVLTPTEFSGEQKDIWQNEMFQSGVQKVVFHNLMEVAALNDSGIVIHAGHSYSEIGLFFKGKMISHKTIFFAGKQMDEQIQRLVAQKSQCLISEEDACSLKEKATQAFRNKSKDPIQCYGYNRYQQFVVLNIKPADIWPAMENVIHQIAMWAKDELNKLDGEKKLVIQQGGVYLSGGLAECYGMQSILSRELHVSCDKISKPSWAMVERVKGWK
ncbi:MAG: rod shape-determining protein [Firmicutes bacterium]|nr:rod shape-determining protein [Bacillota bacterium]